MVISAKISPREIQYICLSAKLNPREIKEKRTKTKEFGQKCTYTAKLNPREILKNPSSAKLNPREKSKIRRPRKLIRAKINSLKVGLNLHLGKKLSRTLETKLKFYLHASKQNNI